MRRILKALATVTIISAITRGIAFLFKIYLSRKLGAEILGVYQITMSIFVLLISLPSSGIPTALSRHIASLEGRGESLASRGILTSGLLLSSSIALIIMIVAYSFPNVTSLLFHDKRCLHMFYIILPALFSTSIYAIIRSYFWANGKFLVYSNSELLEEALSALLIVLTLALGLFGSDLSQRVAIAFVISDYIATILLVVIFFMYGGRLAKPSMLKPLIKSAIPMTSTRLLGSCISSMMALLLPILLVKSGMDTASSTACYGRASGMVMPLVFVPSTIIGALAVVIVPELAKDKARGLDISMSVTSSIRFAIVVSCIFLSLFIAVGGDLTSLLYGDKIAGEYMRIACFLMVPMAINQMAVSSLNTLGHESDTFKCHIIGSIILTILIMILPKYLGIYAYFVGLLVFHILTAMMYIGLLIKYHAMKKEVVKSSLILIILSIILGYGAKLIAKQINNDILSILIVGIMLSIIYIIMLMKCGYIDINIIKGKFAKNHIK